MVGDGKVAVTLIYGEAYEGTGKGADGREAQRSETWVVAVGENWESVPSPKLLTL